MAQWNFADVWETVADAGPDRTAQVHGGITRRWAELDRRADGVAAALLGAGLERHATVALDLYNGPEYLEAAFAAFKASLIPVNTNYRYGHDELVHLWNDAAAGAVVFHGELTETVDRVRDEVPSVRMWIHVDDGTVACPSWAVPYEQLADSATSRTRAPGGRSGDDRVIIYTGGTTGRPKGVVWRQHDLYRVSDVAHDPDVADLDHVRSRVAEPGPVGLPASPLMHGTGFVFATTLLSRGGTVVTATARKLDVPELLDLITSHRVAALCIVGDAFCRPIVEALDANPGRWDVSGLAAVSSSGMAWSADAKQALLAHAPDAVLVDMLSSSEASGMGRSVTSSRRSGSAARFQLGKNSFVVDDQGEPVTPGSGKVGQVAVRGILPLGYHNDPEKTAATFPVIQGERCSVPGDYATVESDGSVTLLGRGSTSINTGGEKVFPEEVEEALKTHAEVEDALVVGVPDERRGAVVAAVVALHGGVSTASPDLAERLTAHVRDRLAGYKAPRHVVPVDSVGRGPNGKADYMAVQRHVEQWLAAEPSGRRS